MRRRRRRHVVVRFFDDDFDGEWLILGNYNVDILLFYCGILSITQQLWHVRGHVRIPDKQHTQTNFFLPRINTSIVVVFVVIIWEGSGKEKGQSQKVDTEMFSTYLYRCAVYQCAVYRKATTISRLRLPDHFASDCGCSEPNAKAWIVYKYCARARAVTWLVTFFFMLLVVQRLFVQHMFECVCSILCCASILRGAAEMVFAYRSLTFWHSFFSLKKSENKYDTTYYDDDVHGRARAERSIHAQKTFHSGTLELIQSFVLASLEVCVSASVSVCV